MQKISLNLLRELTAVQAEPCISIYMPTHPIRPESPRDPITFKNLYKKTAQYIADHKLTVHETILPNILKLVDNNGFWDNAHHGVAILASTESVTILHLSEPVEEVAYVSDSFYLKPLFKLHQENQAYYLLALNLDDVTLYSGDKYDLEVAPANEELPRSMKDALGDQLTDNHLHGSVVIGAGLHGYMEKSQEQDIDMDRFFREVDRSLLEHVPSSKEAPLILAALPEHHTAFLNISKYPHYAPLHILTNPLAWGKDTLLEKTREVWSELRKSYHSDLITKFRDTAHKGLGCSDLACAIRDAYEGKIEFLCLAETDITDDLEFVTSTSETLTGQQLHQDELTKLIQTTFTLGGKIVIIPKDEMPTDTGFFSLNRY